MRSPARGQVSRPESFARQLMTAFEALDGARPWVVGVRRGDPAAVRAKRRPGGRSAGRRTPEKHEHEYRADRQFQGSAWSQLLTVLPPQSGIGGGRGSTPAKGVTYGRSTSEGQERSCLA